MQSKKMMVMLAVASAMVFVGCGKKNATATAPAQSVETTRVQSHYPSLILDGLEDQRLVNTISAVGMGEGRGDMVLVKRMADADGDRRIAAFFQQHIGAIYEEYRALTNNTPERHIQDAIVVRINERISGSLELARYTVRETEQNGTNRIFVIRYIAGQELINAMNDAISQLQNNNPSQNLATQLRASRAFKKVEDMMNNGTAIQAIE